jgi:hypothetical protein
MIFTINIKKIETCLDNILNSTKPSKEDIKFISELPEHEIEYLKTLSTDYLSLENEKKYLQNYEALAELKKKQSIYNKVIMVATGANAVGLSVGNPIVVLASSALSLISSELSTPTDRLVRVMETLLEHFGNDGITLTPDVRTETGKIELFVKLPDRRNFALMLRSNGDCLIKWRIDRGDFVSRVRSKNKTKNQVYGGILPAISNLNAMTVSLKQEKSYLIGLSSKERTQAIIKVLVLTSKTRVDPNNDPSLFVDFGNTKALRVNPGCSIYVVDLENLTNFFEVAEKKSTN